MNAPAPRRSPIPDWAVEAIETQQRQLFTIAAILQVLEAACASGSPRFDHVPAVVADAVMAAHGTRIGGTQPTHPGLHPAQSLWTYSDIAARLTMTVAEVERHLVAGCKGLRPRTLAPRRFRDRFRRR
jgi:hypothetical protein